MSIQRLAVIGASVAWLASLGPALDAQAPPAPKNFKPARVAVVNISDIFDGYQKTKDLDLKFQNEVKAAKGKLGELDAEIRQKEEEIKNLAEGSASHKEAVLKRTELEYKKKALELETMRDLEEKQSNLIGGIRKEISEEIAGYSVAMDLDLVLERQITAASRSPKEKEAGRWPIVHYVKPELEITQEILQRLNAKYGKPNPAAPSSDSAPSPGAVPAPAPPVNPANGGKSGAGGETKGKKEAEKGASKKG